MNKNCTFLSNAHSCNRQQYLSKHGHAQVNMDVTKWSYYYKRNQSHHNWL